MRDTTPQAPLSAVTQRKSMELKQPFPGLVAPPSASLVCVEL